jgi:hypothetical protein
MPASSAGTVLPFTYQKGSGMGDGGEGVSLHHIALLPSLPLVAAGSYKYHSCLWMLQEVT